MNFGIISDGNDFTVTESIFSRICGFNTSTGTFSLSTAIEYIVDFPLSTLFDNSAYINNKQAPSQLPTSLPDKYDAKLQTSSESHFAAQAFPSATNKPLRFTFTPHGLSLHSPLHKYGFSPKHFNSSISKPASLILPLTDSIIDPSATKYPPSS